MAVAKFLMGLAAFFVFLLILFAITASRTKIEDPVFYRLAAHFLVLAFFFFSAALLSFGLGLLW